MANLQTALDELQQRFGGTLLTPPDAGYEQARVLFNTMITRRPAVIAQCSTVADVRAAIAFARRV